MAPDMAEWKEEEGDEEKFVRDGRVAREVAAGSRKLANCQERDHGLQRTEKRKDYGLEFDVAS
jgi:hypothetical protein